MLSERITHFGHRWELVQGQGQDKPIAERSGSWNLKISWGSQTVSSRQVKREWCSIQHLKSYLLSLFCPSYILSCHISSQTSVISSFLIFLFVYFDSEIVYQLRDKVARCSPFVKILKSNLISLGRNYLLLHKVIYSSSTIFLALEEWDIVRVKQWFWKQFMNFIA